MITPFLPEGVNRLGEKLWTQAGHSPAPDRIQELLEAPLNLEPNWPAPTQPIPVAGGHVHIEVVDDDRELLHEIMASSQNAGPEALAATAQALRLAVTPYRQAPRAMGRPKPSADSESHDGQSPTADPSAAKGALIVDLTTHWAGPLATALFAEAGATVVKVDPECRPDGFRPRSRLYRELNGNKEIVDLDLRRDSDRECFESLLVKAELVVESFSRRVMGNLGYDADRLRLLAPNLRHLSIKAHPTSSPERDWLGYGPAIHAISGLAFGSVSVQGSRPAPMPCELAYPDPLAGLAAYGLGLRMLGAADRKHPQRHGEVTLRGSVQPLVDAQGTARRAGEQRQQVSR